MQIAAGVSVCRHLPQVRHSASVSDTGPAAFQPAPAKPVRGSSPATPPRHHGDALNAAPAPAGRTSSELKASISMRFAIEAKDLGAALRSNKRLAGAKALSNLGLARGGSAKSTLHGNARFAVPALQALARRRGTKSPASTPSRRVPLALGQTVCALRPVQGGRRGAGTDRFARPSRMKARG